MAAHRAMAGSQLEVLDPAGHFPHRSDPAPHRSDPTLHRSDPTRFVTVLAGFVAENPPAAFEAERWQGRLRAGN
jgi:pimeloyl-ACP methyl ester carboxylesterase